MTANTTSPNRAPHRGICANARPPARPRSRTRPAARRRDRRSGTPCPAQPSATHPETTPDPVRHRNELRESERARNRECVRKKERCRSVPTTRPATSRCRDGGRPAGCHSFWVNDAASHCHGVSPGGSACALGDGPFNPRPIDMFHVATRPRPALLSPFSFSFLLLLSPLSPHPASPRHAETETRRSGLISPRSSSRQCLWVDHRQRPRRSPCSTLRGGRRQLSSIPRTAYSIWVPGTRAAIGNIIGEWIRAAGNRRPDHRRDQIGWELRPTSKGLSHPTSWRPPKFAQALQTDYIDLYQSHRE